MNIGVPSLTNAGAYFPGVKLMSFETEIDTLVVGTVIRGAYEQATIMCFLVLAIVAITQIGF